MTPERWQRIQELFSEAIARAPESRTAFVEEACAGDEGLRVEIQELLRYDGPGQKLEQSVREDIAGIAQAADPAWQTGKEIGRYRILREIGRGGMGAVYLAERSGEFQQQVAIKLIHAGMATAGMLQRFRNERQILAGLDHPNIARLFDGGSTGDGRPYFVMEFIEGQPLDQYFNERNLSIEARLGMFRGICSAVHYAHQNKVVHRDLKPANILVTPDGVPKLLDFGIARLVEAGRQSTPTATVERMLTLGYASPEQVRGGAITPACDVYSLGVILYELLTGCSPYQASGQDPIELAREVCEGEPEAPSSAIRRRPGAHAGVARRLRGDLDNIVLLALRKEPERRYASAGALSEDLRCHLEGLPVLARKPTVTYRALKFVRRRTAATVAWGLLLILAGGAWWGVKQWRARWVYRQAIPEMFRLAADNRSFEAWELGLEAEKILPHDATLERAFSTFPQPVPLQSQPAGARIYYQPYLEPQARERLLGQTNTTARLPLAMLRVRLVKEGFEDLEGTVEAGADPPVFLLDAKGARPAGMVAVPATRRGLSGKPVELPPFWLDKYEVSNREFQTFVDQGGYGKREYWKHPFLKNGREISWNEAMPLFVDTTGRPGPSTWAHGRHQEDRGDYPVAGVSWYEAAAYAEFAGKSLPTVFHWLRAANFGQGMFSDILKLSNLAGQGPAQRGRFQGLGPFGTYDMAGNVKEWCFNAVGAQRAILGGAWSEASYRYRSMDGRDPMERLPIFGFRCAKFSQPPPEAFGEPLRMTSRDPAKDKPASEETFRAWRNSFAYDHTPLESKLEAADDTPEYYRKEKITFAASYGGERVAAWLFLPRNAAPPYQTVVFYPAGEAPYTRSSSGLGPQKTILFIMQSGRALLHPVYQGMYERSRPRPAGPNAFRDLMIQRSQDMRRSVDYLETRKDIDVSKLAYFGVSSGCREGMVMVPMEPRFRVAILFSCGIPAVRQAEGTDPVDFAPRFKIPALLINGRDDFSYPYATSQLPLFQLLGAPRGDKKLVMRDGGHFGTVTPDLEREVTGWLDHYLGGVR